LPTRCSDRSARYRAERDEIATRYAEWKITGPAEIRDVTRTAGL